MVQAELQVAIRKPTDGTVILDLQGPIGRSAQEPLVDAYEKAIVYGADSILLNFGGVEAMDSMGMELLMALLARAEQQGKRLAAYGLSLPLQHAFQLVHLHEGVPVYPDEAAALGSAGEERLSEPRAEQGAGTQGHWAEPVDRLAVPDLSAEAINLNVQGRQPTGPMKGFGPLWLRTYQIRLAGSNATPAEVIRVWKEKFADFWPEGSSLYGAQRAIEAGDVGVLNLAGPAGTTISTGILVIYADETSFCFLSVEGHMFGGMITFTAYEQGGTTVVQVRALLRSSDPVYEMGQRMGFAVKAEDAFWHGTLASLAAHFGVQDEPVHQEATLLDKSIRWSRATNLWYNAAIRTSLHLPIRLARGLFGR
jgi:anti-anti-sigma factor